MVRIMLAGVLLQTCLHAAATEANSNIPPSIEQSRSITEWLILMQVGVGGRRPFPCDPITYQIVRGAWTPPDEGDTIRSVEGKQAEWQKAASSDNTELEHKQLRGGWAYAKVESDIQRRAILRAKGHSVVYVNGQPRVGDPYRLGYVMIPIVLKAGDNHLLFRCERTPLSAVLEPVTDDLMVNMADATLPDALEGDRQALPAGLVLLNTTMRSLRAQVMVRPVTDSATISRPIDGLTDQASVGGNVGPRWMPPLAIAKVPAALEFTPADGDLRKYRLTKAPGTDDHGSVQAVDFEIPVRGPQQYRKVTFTSNIDGSVQYYGLRPRVPPNDGLPGGLVIHLHGASDEASMYRKHYSPKNWTSIVNATNRRPYGFAWEDWGRLDTLEVLEHATRLVKPDPSRIYLAGHSMGGHGVWHIAAHFPDRFAAIGPAAAWTDVWSYGPGAATYELPNPIQSILDKCVNASRNKLLAENYAHHGVFIVHGDADKVVGIEHAYTMRDLISPFHHDFVLHVQPGGGHVYDATPEEGTDCFDLMELFEFFQHHARPPAPRAVKFVTISPGINGTCHWVRIEQQCEQMIPSRVALQIDPGRRVLFGVSKNVARLTLDPTRIIVPGPLTLELDGDAELKIEWDGQPIHLKRSEGKWQITGPLPPTEKGPHRHGLFKDAFRNHVLLVIGTAGSDSENAWTLTKARYDAETFWYRGNGSFELALDTEFDPSANADRNVILYGNADTNRAWQKLMDDSPVQISCGQITVGEKRFVGEDLGCLLIRLRPGSDTACVGLVGGTGLPGMRATDVLPYFVTGVAYPDCVVFRAGVWQSADRDVLAAGLFGNDWSIQSGEFAFAEP